MYHVGDGEAIELGAPQAKHLSLLLLQLLAPLEVVDLLFSTHILQFSCYTLMIEICIICATHSNVTMISAYYYYYVVLRTPLILLTSSGMPSSLEPPALKTSMSLSSMTVLMRHGQCESVLSES